MGLLSSGGMISTIADCCTWTTYSEPEDFAGERLLGGQASETAKRQTFIETRQMRR
jgi:hypothetical protein